MTTINGSSSNGGVGVLGAGYATSLGSGSVAGLSPDALLEYCATQMNGLDDQINTLMAQQETQLTEQEAVESVETTLEGFGTAGPTDANDMQTCINAFNTAIAGLPQGDPVAVQLQTQLSAMEQKYGMPGTTYVSTNPLLSGMNPFGAQVNGAPQTPQLTNGTFQKPTGNDWTATTDALGDLASNIKSNAQLQFLSLQDKVSQQQDLIEQSTNMMSKENDTLLDQAKAIGA
jgi:hypothetical protein